MVQNIHPVDLIRLLYHLEDRIPPLEVEIPPLESLFEPLGPGEDARGAVRPTVCQLHHCHFVFWS